MAFPWFWIPSPLAGNAFTDPTKATPNVEHLPIVTRKGRVVYNRRVHTFSDNDILRINSKRFELGKRQNNANWLMRLLEAMTIFMLDKILEKLTDEEIDDEIVASLYYVMRNSLARIIERLPSRIVETLEANPIYPYLP